MEDIITQKFRYATITHYRDYSKLSDKTKSLNSKSIDLDVFDCEEDLDNSTNRLKIFFESNSRVGRIISFPEKRGKRRTNFFYGDSDINESCTLNYAIRGFETTKDRHIIRHYGNPFSQISVTTIERSIRVHGDKVTIKLYRHNNIRQFNSIYFKKSTTVESVTFNKKTGNFTTLIMNKSGKKNTKTFRVNSFALLDVLFNNGGILEMRDPLDKKSILFGEYKKIFNNSTFANHLNEIFELNQNFSFNGTWFSQLMLEHFIKVKNIKVSNDYGMWIKKYYPTEKFLKKNDRKLIASILDMFQIKSKVTIKIMHENTKIDIYALCRLCYFFGDNFSKYIGSIDSSHFLNSSFDESIQMGSGKFNFAKECKKDNFVITNIEKENIVKIINNLKTEHDGFTRLIGKRETLVNQRFINDLYDHFKMIHKLREYIPNLHLKARHYDEFNVEHLELSKMMRFIKKGYVTEYRFADKMIEDIQTPIKVKINLGDDLNPSFVTPEYYPYILKREEEYDEEGRFMHHCVASYSDKDKSIIVSVRTEDSKDRVTCEFDCQTGSMIQARHFCNGNPPDDIALAIEELKVKAKTYARMGILHCIEKKQVPVMINGVEITPEKKELKSQEEFNRLFEHF